MKVLIYWMVKRHYFPPIAVTDLSAATQALSSHIKKCTIISCTSIDEPSPLTSYAENHSSTKATSCQRSIYVGGGAAWIQEVKISFNAYQKSILTPSSTSYLGMLMRIATSMIQLTISWIVGRINRMISTLINATSNGNMVLQLYSHWMACLGRRIQLYSQL